MAFLVVSLGVHEAAHGWVALKCGDTTARDMGRITLNPFAHIDLFLTIILPTLLILMGRPPFGGAKPVPVNFHNLRRPYRDMALVAIAGPASNFALAMLFFLARKVVVGEMRLWTPGAVGDQVLQYSILFNLVLAAFNLLPIPPLDGSRIMTWLLPAGLRPAYMRFESFGILLVFFLIYTVPQLIQFVWDTVWWLESLVETIVTLGGAW